MLMRIPRAPSMLVSSSSGLDTALFAASTAALLPPATAVPITAYPIPCMIVRTSAKSRLMIPGIVMISLIPWTAWRRMSSAIRNDSKKLVPRSTTSIRRSFGMVTTVSTVSASSASPCSAIFMRWLPSKENGLVTTATVSAPSSLASEVTMGAAPVPVPPPSPAVTKTMSESPKSSIRRSVSSSAASRPTSAFDPAPRPLVNREPSCSLTCARETRNACSSVLMAANTTPSTPASIMRLTALQPAPPTPMTLMRALVPAVSSKVNFTASLLIAPPFWV